MDIGYTEAIITVLAAAGRPLATREIILAVDTLSPIPFTVWEETCETIRSLLVGEVKKPSPRWKKVSRGVYATVDWKPLPGAPLGTLRGPRSVMGGHYQ